MLPQDITEDVLTAASPSSAGGCTGRTSWRTWSRTATA